MLMYVDVKIFQILCIIKGKTDHLNPRFGEGSVFDLSHMKTENIAKKLDFVDFLSFENDFSKVEI